MYKAKSETLCRFRPDETSGRAKFRPDILSGQAHSTFGNRHSITLTTFPSTLSTFHPQLADFLRH